MPPTPSALDGVRGIQPLRRRRPNRRVPSHQPPRRL